MTLPGLVAAKNLADVEDREKTWDNLGTNVSVEYGLSLGLDPDASAYIQAVALVDNDFMEPLCQLAINEFVLNCKASGIWSSIKSCCILAGAKTLDGALVPLIGPAPTNFNFIASDYNRKTGLRGNASTKYLNTNRTNQSDPQNNRHAAVYATVANTSAGFGAMIASRFNPGGTAIGRGFGSTLINFSGPQFGIGTGDRIGFHGVSRSNSTSLDVVSPFGQVNVVNTSQAPTTGSIFILRALENDTHSNARIFFFSTGEALNLTLLSLYVDRLVNEFADAIP